MAHPANEDSGTTEVAPELLASHSEPGVVAKAARHSALTGVVQPVATAAPSIAATALAFWIEPSFRRRMAESYIADTDVEPPLTEDEGEEIQEILLLIGQDQLEPAIQRLEAARGPAASAVFDFTLGNVYFQREELERAAEAYRVAVEKHAKFRRAWQQLGVCRFRLGRFEEAIPALAKRIELGSADGLTYGLLGHSYANMDDAIAAELAYRSAIVLDPRTLDWRLGLTRSLFRLGRFSDAISLCDTLIAEQEDSVELWLLQANAYIGAGEPMRAAENYEMVDALGGSTVESLENLGDIYANAQLFDVAVEAYLRALELSPNAKIDRAMRAARLLVAHQAHGDLRTLLDGIDRLRADTLGPEEKVALLKMNARLAVAEGAGDEQARILQEIVDLDPLDGEALILLGQYHARSGRIEQAEFQFQRAANLEDHEAKAKLEHGRMLVSDGRYAEAVPLLRRAHDLKPRESLLKYLEQVERIARGR